MMDKKIDGRVFLILIILWVSVTAGNWLAVSSYRYPWPHPGRGSLRTDIEKLKMERSVEAAIKSDAPGYAKILRIAGLLKTPVQRPKLVHLAASLGDLAFGEKNSRIFLAAVYYLLLILGTYLVARQFYGKDAGILSAVLISLNPGIFQLSKTYELDFPLTAFFIFTMYLLLNTRNFRGLLISLIFGVFLGAGILIKGSIVIFLITPFFFCAYYAFRDYRSGGYNPFRTALNILIALFIAAAISALWWGGDSGSVFFKFPLYLSDKIRGLMSTPYSLPEAPAGLFSKLLQDTLRFFAQLVRIASVELCLLFIIFIPFFLKRRPRNNLLIFSLVIPLAILYFSALKAARYFMPLLPLTAIMISAGIYQIRNGVIRKAAITLACAVILGRFLFSMSFRPEDKQLSIKAPIYAKCSQVSTSFLKLATGHNHRPAAITFISESSDKDSDPMVVIQYFMEKQRRPDLTLEFGLNNIDRSSYILLLFDRKYYLKVAALLEAGRKSGHKGLYLSLCRSYMVSDGSFCVNLMDPGKFDQYVHNIAYRARSGSIRRFEFFEKLLVLEAIKRGYLTFGEASKGGQDGVLVDIFAWSNVYNWEGLGGLSREFTLTYPEFKSWLETGSLSKPLTRDMRWRWLYKKITSNNFVIIGREEIPQLEMEVYLLSREPK